MLKERYLTCAFFGLLSPLINPTSYLLSCMSISLPMHFPCFVYFCFSYHTAFWIYFINSVSLYSAQNPGILLPLYLFTNFQGNWLSAFNSRRTSEFPILVVFIVAILRSNASLTDFFNLQNGVNWTTHFSVRYIFLIDWEDWNWEMMDCHSQLWFARYLECLAFSSHIITVLYIMTNEKSYSKRLAQRMENSHCNCLLSLWWAWK